LAHAYWQIQFRRWRRRFSDSYSNCYSNGDINS